ncbi:MAG: hypothetical protein IJ935_05305 [Afipia sp.]|nr:hypothetical protein [Afipia sp.]
MMRHGLVEQGLFEKAGRTRNALAGFSFSPALFSVHDLDLTEISGAAARTLLHRIDAIQPRRKRRLPAPKQAAEAEAL